MNVLVHLLIAGSVRRAVLDETGFRLSGPAFLYGSILPDISRRYDDNPHFLKDSIDFVLISAGSLDGGPTGRAAGRFDYSRQAGVITHYLSDFFCYAHSDQAQFNMMEHHFYEFVMLFLFRKGRSFYKKLPSGGMPGTARLREYIEENVRDYMSGANRRTRDIGFAIRVSAAVTGALVRNGVRGSQTEAPASVAAQPNI